MPVTNDDVHYRSDEAYVVINFISSSLPSLKIAKNNQLTNQYYSHNSHINTDRPISKISRPANIDFIKK